MAEYIEREATIKALAQMQWHDENGYSVDDYEEKKKYAEDWISQVPSADVQPVKHGRWVQDAVYVDETTGEPCLAWFCNQCGEPQMVGTNYCPNCGARMDGEA